MRRHKIAISVAVYGAILITGYQNFMTSPANLTPDCNPQKLKEVLEAATPERPDVSIQCNLKLTNRNVITKRLVITGEKASGVVVDCGGGNIYGGTPDPSQDLIKIISLKSEDDPGTIRWSQPQKVQIRNCNIHGTIRVAGVSPNGIEQDFVLSNRRPLQAQEASLPPSPPNVSVENLTIYGSRQIFWGH